MCFRGDVDAKVVAWHGVSKQTNDGDCGLVIVFLQNNNKQSMTKLPNNNKMRDKNSVASGSDSDKKP